MQTVLPTEIKTVNQAKAFLAALYFNGESYDPADDANDILFVGEQPTQDELSHLNKLMEDIYNLPEVMATPATFDPPEFFNSLDPQYTLNMLRDTIEGICMQDGDIKTDGECMDEVLKFIGSVHTMEDVNGYDAQRKAAAQKSAFIKMLEWAKCLAQDIEVGAIQYEDGTTYLPEYVERLKNDIQAAENTILG